jgi:G3E family GTPase
MLASERSLLPYFLAGTKSGTKIMSSRDEAIDWNDCIARVAAASYPNNKIDIVVMVVDCGDAGQTVYQAWKSFRQDIEKATGCHPFLVLNKKDMISAVELRDLIKFFRGEGFLPDFIDCTESYSEADMVTKKMKPRDVTVDFNLIRVASKILQVGRRMKRNQNQ